MKLSGILFLSILNAQHSNEIEIQLKALFHQVVEVGIPISNLFSFMQYIVRHLGTNFHFNGNVDNQIIKTVLCNILIVKNLFLYLYQNKVSKST